MLLAAKLMTIPCRVASFCTVCGWLKHVQTCAATTVTIFDMASHELKMYGWRPDLSAVPV